MPAIPRRLIPYIVSTALILAACSTAAPAPEATPTATPVATPTPVPTPTATPTPEPTPTATSAPSNVLFRYTAAVRLLRAAQYEDAIPAFDIVIRVLPNFSEAYHGRGLAFYHNEQEAPALEDFNKAIELKPDYADAYRNRGVLYLNSGDVFNGTADLQMALDLYVAAGDTLGIEDLRQFLPAPH